jgi:hypothetical protein
LGVGIVVLALAFLLAEWALTPPPGVTGANARRVRKGMTVRQAERLLGGPPQRWAPYRSRLRGRTRQVVDVWYCGEWESEPVTVCIDFDPTGRVEEVEVLGEPHQGSELSFLSRLRAWLVW